MSSFWRMLICARCASNAAERSDSRLSAVSAIRARWSPTSRKYGAASGWMPSTLAVANRVIGSRNGITARRTSASSRFST